MRRATRGTRGPVRAIRLAGAKEQHLFAIDDLQVLQCRSSDLSIVERWVGCSDNPAMSLTAGMVPELDDDSDVVGSGLVVASGHMQGDIILHRALLADGNEGSDNDDGCTLRMGTSAVRALTLAGSVLAAGNERGDVRIFGIALTMGARIRSQFLCRLPAISMEVECLELAATAGFMAIGRSGDPNEGGLSLWSLSCEDPLPEPWALTDDETDELTDDDDAARSRGRLVPLVDHSELSMCDVYALSLLEEEGALADERERPASGEGIGASTSSSWLLLAGSARGDVTLWRLPMRRHAGMRPGVPRGSALGVAAATLAAPPVQLWSVTRDGSIMATALSRRGLAVAAADCKIGTASSTSGTMHLLVRESASGRCRELALPNAQSADCANTTCSPGGSLWSGQWQVPAAVECPVCSSTFPVVNALTLSDQGGADESPARVELWHGGYDQRLHAWEGVWESIHETDESPACAASPSAT